MALDQGLWTKKAGPCPGARPAGRNWHENTQSFDKFLGDFETGDITGFRVSGNPSTVVQDPVRSGHYSLESSLDRNTDDVPYRTELTAIVDPHPNVGDEEWYGFSIYLPDSYIPDSISEIAAQWHGVPDFDLGEDWRNPLLALHTTNGQRWTAAFCTTTNSG